MIRRLLALALFTVVLAACSSGGASVPTTNPTATPAGPASTPGGVPTAAPNNGDVESIARALVPPGSNEVSGVPAGGSYTLIVTTTMSLEELKTFYATAIAASGVTSSAGPLEVSGTLTYSLTGPDGGVVVTPGGAEGNLITISVGQT